jgi:hypothetical protein
LPIREVYLRLAAALEPSNTDIGHHSDDGPFREREPEAAAEGILVRPVAPGKDFAYHRQRSPQSATSGAPSGIPSVRRTGVANRGSRLGTSFPLKRDLDLRDPPW